MSGPGGTRLPSRRALLLALFGGASVAVGGAFSMWNDRGERPAQNGASPGREREAPRFVSLSPGVTEALLRLDPPGEIAGISDYCEWPSDRGPAPARVGSALTPRYEQIARLEPTRILTSDVAGQQLEPLAKLADTRSLPWLTVAQMSSSLRELGNLVGRARAGERMGREIQRSLPDKPAKGAPRVLFAFDGGGAKTADTWFIRRNSIHGAVLHAAGGRNAVDEDVIGQPKVSPEELLRLDPEAIIVLRSGEPDPKKERESLTRFMSLHPLSATRHGRLSVLSAPGALSVGPSVLELIAPLARILKDMFPELAEKGAGD